MSEHHPSYTVNNQQTPHLSPQQGVVAAGNEGTFSSSQNYAPLYDANQYGMVPQQSYQVQAAPYDTGFLGMNFRDQQFWKGALLGAAVALLVTNETVQKSVIKGAAKVVSAVQGGVQEVKEKFEDVRAEMHQANGAE